MNRMWNIRLSIVLTVLLGLFVLPSCRKESPTIAIIKVVDSSGAVIKGAKVKLYPEPTVSGHSAIVIEDVLYSDVNGEATFDYTDKFNLGQVGFAILDIEIWSGDTLNGTGIIKVQEEETSQETVVLLP